MRLNQILRQAERFWKGSLGSSERLRSMRAVRPCAGDRYAVLVSGPERIGSYALCTRSKTNLLRMPRAMAGNYAGQFCRVCQRHLAKRAMGRSFFCQRAMEQFAEHRITGPCGIIVRSDCARFAGAADRDQGLAPLNALRSRGGRRRSTVQQREPWCDPGMRGR